ncbi:MAG: ATP-binding cassette domain-containing protein, partial [Anaerolineaceae bacterium]|nr:ATP-binding cassette domain-containing protein [Anaerolineaceae bacterium]
MDKIKISIRNLHLRYEDGKYPLRGINLDIFSNKINVIFGPAGGGKSSLIRILNRLIDLSDVKELRGEVLLDGVNILDPEIDVIELRRRVGVVFSRPIP